MERKVERKVEFYRIYLDYLPLLSDEEKIKNKFVNTLLTNVKINEPYTLKQDNEDTNVRIEVLEINRNFMFGILGKLEDIRDGILKRLRKKEDDEIIDPQKEQINLLIENYTYFYVRFNDMQCAVITNNAAPRFRKHFNNYLKAMVEGKITELKSVSVAIRLDNQTKHKLNRFRTLHQIKMIYDDSSEIGNRILRLSDLYDISQTSIKEARVDITFYGTPLPEKARKLLSNDEIVKSNFKRFEMYGEDDDKEQIEIELVENILIKRVTIDIDDEYLRYPNDLDKIKQALADSFPVT